MFRQTPLTSGFYAYNGGGARCLIDTADDGHFMQESKSTFMRGEQRSKIESPQNYGFTSVVAKATKDKQGRITGSAEGFVSFMGSSRSFPVITVMDDRRHRLRDLKEGDVALFRGKDDQNQIHLNEDGGFWSNRNDRKTRIQMVKKKEKQEQGGPQSQPTVSALANGGGGGGGGGGSGSGGQSESEDFQQEKLEGQQAQYKEESKTYLELDGDNNILAKRGEGHQKTEDNKIQGYWKDETHSYQVTDRHIHIRFKQFRVWIDETGIWSTIPIQVKQDPMDHA
jgi:phage gp45-like